jgi:hypothetical protein
MGGPLWLCCWFTFCVLEEACVRLRMRCERHPFDWNDGPKEVAGELLEGKAIFGLGKGKRKVGKDQKGKERQREVYYYMYITMYSIYKYLWPIYILFFCGAFFVVFFDGGRLDYRIIIVHIILYINNNITLL